MARKKKEPEGTTILDVLQHVFNATLIAAREETPLLDADRKLQTHYAPAVEALVDAIQDPEFEDEKFNIAEGGFICLLAALRIYQTRAKNE